MNDKYYTVREVSQILNLTEATVRNYINLGRLKSDKVFNSTVVSKKEVDRYIKHLNSHKD